MTVSSKMYKYMASFSDFEGDHCSLAICTHTSMLMFDSPLSVEQVMAGSINSGFYIQRSSYHRLLSSVQIACKV